MHILIVEDNEINAKVLSLMLRELTFEATVSVASDAAEALEQTTENQFDLILMDINLGDGMMDGTEVMKQLKVQDSYCTVPMYAVTCYSLPGDKEKFLDEGFDRYFSKPVVKDQLLRTIEEDRPTNS